MARFASLKASELGDDLKVVAFRGVERLCRPYRFDVHFTVGGDASVDLANGIGSRATLTFMRENDVPHRFNGVLASANLLVQTGGWALYRATLVPMVWRLGLTMHSNAFTKISVPDLIEKILEDSTLTADDFELRLDGSYEEEELIVQYRESNLDFIQRWMEHQGLYYFFEQSEDREKMVIVDHRSFHAKMVDKKVRYRPIAEDDTSAEEAFDTFAAMYNDTVEKVRLADYDYSRPALDVSATKDVSQHGFGEWSIHAGRFFDPGMASRFAEIRAEELQSREVTFHMAGTALQVSAGYLVELEEHPAEAMNKEYMVTETHHFGNLLAEGASELGRWVETEFQEIYRVQAHAIDAAKQYRAPLTTHWPRVDGYEAGIVDGEADSPYAQIDDHGRYKVKFHFDESDLSEGKASTYVRMMQPHGGTTEGFHFPLRKGTEVIFTFLGGDPDRPVIAGVVPNATTPSPITSENNTKNKLVTGSGSHLTIDDAAGKEYIHLHSPKLTEMFLGGPTDKHADQHTNKTFAMPPSSKTPPGGEHNWEHVPCTWYTYTDGNAGFFIDGQSWTDVGEDIFIHGGGKLGEYYESDHFLNIGGSSKQWYHSTVHREMTGKHTIKVHADEDRWVDGTYKLEATSDMDLNTPAYDLFANNTLKMWTKEATIDFTSKASLTFGETTLRWKATDVNITSLSGRINSVDLTIPQTCTIKAPKWDLQTGKYGDTFGYKWEAGILALGATAFKEESVGQSLTVQGVGITVSVFAGLQAALKKDDEGAKNENNGADAQTSGIKSFLQGLVSFS